jgi:hypothetical protein
VTISSCRLLNQKDNGLLALAPAVVIEVWISRGGGCEDEESLLFSHDNSYDQGFPSHD